MTRQNIIMMLVMTLLMGIVLSAVFTWQAIGFAPGFVAQWASRFVQTYPVVVPTVLLIAPIAQRVAARIERTRRSASPSGSDVSVALAAWRANALGHRGGGFDDWLGRLRDDVSITMPLGPFRGVNRGIDKAREIYALIAGAEPRLKYEEPVRVSSAEGCVVIEFADAGTIAGQRYSNRIAASFDIREGKVAAYREYFGDVDPAVVAMMNRADSASS